MKRIALATTALLLLSVGAASAADLAARPYTKAQPPIAAVYNWTGFYIGGHIGGAFAGDSTVNNSSGQFLGGVPRAPQSP